MRAFITHAQSFNPTIPAALHNYIVAKYVEKRKFQGQDYSDQSYMYVTPRMLLGIIRISQALAKLNFRNEVTINDVDESLKLMDFSFRSLKLLTGKDSEKREAQRDHKRDDFQSVINQKIREIFQANNELPIAVNEIYKRLTQKYRISI